MREETNPNLEIYEGENCKLYNLGAFAIEDMENFF